MPQKRKPRDRNKFNTAIAGKTFASRPDLETRWGLGPVSVKARLKEAIELGLVSPVNFTGQTIRYSLEDIARYEEFKRIRGLEAVRKQKANRILK